VRQVYRYGVARGELPSAPWASEAVDLITDLPSATKLVRRLAAEAEAAALDRAKSQSS
jgi:hypothetical protein